MEGLHELDISHNELDYSFPDLLEHLSNNLYNLKTLGLSSCLLNFTESELISATGLDHLTRLDLSNCLKDPEEISAITSNYNMKSLKYLKLKNC